ncbi:MAG: DUF2061 domain-containing protein [Bacteroidia bacterium]|nr:DUF2061 domain-containing protein [Bacteroidia bacterium]
MKEYHVRSIVKGITWRVAGTIDTVVIAFVLSGEFSFALSIGGIEVVTKMVLYYLHERAWAKINWGRSRERKHENIDIHHSRL